MGKAIEHKRIDIDDNVSLIWEITDKEYKCFWCEKKFKDLFKHCIEEHPGLSPRSYDFLDEKESSLSEKAPHFSQRKRQLRFSSENGETLYGWWDEDVKETIRNAQKRLKEMIKNWRKSNLPVSEHAIESVDIIFKEEFGDDLI